MKQQQGREQEHVKQNRNHSGQLIEGALLILFLILWGVVVSGNKTGKEALWKKITGHIPLQGDVIRESAKNLMKNARNELAPVLSYEDYVDEDNQLLPTFRYGIQTELFPIQQYIVDYWNDSDNYSAKYGDKVPDYFTESDDVSVEDKKKDPGMMETTGTGTTYTMEQLTDYDFLLKNFYIVDETTELTRGDLNGEKLLKQDLSLNLSGDDPLILIYHTHGSESYKKENGEAGTVIEVGEELAKELENNYNISVIHDTAIYDQVNGELDRNAAYDYAGDSVAATLKKYPSIQVVLDLHRDSVDDSIHLVSEINGKETAQIMFFNGVSRLQTGAIESLYNPNQSANLAFSLQMQLLASKYYPDYTRKIYIKGYRYNLHLAKRAMLVEVGAQNNTAAEAKNAMAPLAELLYRLLSGEKAYE